MNFLIRLFSMITLLFTSTAFAAGFSPAEIVKVESGLCSHADKNFHGSGTLFKKDGSYFVITSEHVILHDNGKYCHQISNSSLGTLPAELVAADWGTGLALLRVSSPLSLAKISATIPTIEALNQSAQDSDNVIVSGFPYASSEIVWDKKGSVLLAHSERTLIPLVRDVIELQNAQGEYGMSGGAVLRESDQAFLGVLSHQVITMVPGSESKISNFANESVIQNHLIVIPTSFVSEWLGSYFSNPSAFTPNFLRDADEQYLGNEVILSSGLSFKLQNASDSKHGSGVGGGDGAGVGGKGGDGAGVGGDANSSEETSGPKIVIVSLSNHHASFSHEALWSSPTEAALLSKLQNSLMQQNNLQIPFLMVRIADDRKVRTEVIESLSQFIHALSFDNTTAKVEEVSLTNENNVTAFQTLGANLQSQSKAMLDSTTLSLDAKQLLTSLKATGDIFASGDSTGIQSADLNAYLKADSAWAELFNLDFDKTVELRKSLVTANTMLN